VATDAVSDSPPSIPKIKTDGFFEILCSEKRKCCALPCE
jgi:hypothetical protein